MRTIAAFSKRLVIMRPPSARPSRKRIDAAEGLQTLCPLPVRHQFPLVEPNPFHNESLDAPRQPASDDGDRVESDDGLVLSVRRMEMRWRVVRVEHPDRDPMELGDGRHPSSPMHRIAEA